MKITIKQKYENLVASVNFYVSAMKAVRSQTAFSYRATEQSPAEHNNPNGPKQFNIVEVRTLITHVLTAKQLGYDTVLTASADQLTVNFVQQRPSIPVSMQML